MAGINRLGKGAAKPGTLRPADPNRFKTQDFFSAGADDPEYLRSVLEVEETFQKQGFIAARGAFDKGDLLYLRDESEKQRNSELELRDQELTAYSRLRSNMDEGPALQLEDGLGPPKKRPRPKVKATAKAIAQAAQEARAAPSTSKSEAGMEKQSVGLLGAGYDSSSDESEGKATAAPARAALAGLPGADELLGDIQVEEQAAAAEPEAAASPSAADTSDDSE